MYKSAVELAEKEFNFIIVDNGSVKSEFDKIANYDFKNCTIVRNDKNLGFAAGNNIGLKQIQEKDVSIIFINSDIIIKERHWDLKFKVMLDQPNVGVVGCSYHPLAWDKNGCFRTLPKPNQPVESETVQGAFFGMKKEALDKVGGFDENFKMAHYEETDLQLRTMLQLGLKCLWFPLEHEHLHNSSATKIHGYKLCSEIQNRNEFRANSEKNRKLLLEKHKEFFNKK
jgi:GT2 family glycosyltransferase